MDGTSSAGVLRISQWQGGLMVQQISLKGTRIDYSPKTSALLF